VQVLHATARSLGGFFERFDALLSPTLAVPPLPLGAASLANTDRATFQASLAASTGFTMLCNATGVPAMSVPLFWNAEGLPIGVQFAGRFGDEATLFRLAAQLEQARPWFSRIAESR
jgi:Asp-tRNA(Asn)/Glu-tRNA(Gln) amidotransferase A subunit family amidase